MSRTWQFFLKRPQPQGGVLALPNAQWDGFSREFKQEDTIGQPKKYMITNPGDSWSHLVFTHKIFERMLPHESFGLQADMLPVYQ